MRTSIARTTHKKANVTSLDSIITTESAATFIFFSSYSPPAILMVSPTWAFAAAFPIVSRDVFLLPSPLSLPFGETNKLPCGLEK